MTRKKPLFLLVEIGLLLSFFAYGLSQTINLHKDYYSDYVLRRERHIEYYLKLGQRLALVGELNELEGLLQEARDYRYFDFFLVQHKSVADLSQPGHGEPVHWGAPKGTGVEDLLAIVQNTPVDGAVITKDLSLKTVPLTEDTFLTIGITKHVEQYLSDSVHENLGVLIQDVLVPSVFALWIFAFYIRDVLQVLRIFRDRKKRDFKQIKTRSREAEVFIQGLAGYEQTLEDLAAQNQTLGNQVLPALKKEILSGRKPPYDFDCTMVRTDINNFSSIFHTHDVKSFMRVINQFFEEVSHIVSRYNGLIHEFVGDEVIFYFKDEEHPNSFMTALSAIRDINDSARRFNEMSLSRHGYPFTVKSSLSHGKIHFGPLVNGYSLAGSILIETVRVLSHIHEKDDNVVYFDGAHRSLVTDLCDVTEATRVQLKGYAGTHTLYSYHGHRELTELLFELNEKTVENLAYYRSDADISRTIRHLKRYQATLAPKTLFKAIQVLKGIRVTQSDGTVATALLDWIECLAKPSLLGDKEGDNRLLSSVIMLAINLIPLSELDDKTENRLAKLLHVQDKRAVANAVEVLTHFKSDGNPQVMHRLLEDENNRITANALVHQGVRSLDSSIIKKLRRMLRSGRAPFIASALYAIGEISVHHRTRDMVYYHAQIAFLKLVQMIPGFVTHPDKMVRRQAFIAAKKSGDELIIAKAQKAADLTGSESILREAGEFLSTPPQDSSSLKAA